MRSILALLEKVDVKGISHITGGGFYENIPRSIPDGLCAKIKKSDVRVLPIFDLIARTGNIPQRDMFNTFNMGVGMSVVVPAAQAIWHWRSWLPMEKPPMSSAKSWRTRKR